MLYAKDLLNFIRKNTGDNLFYGNGYHIQIYHNSDRIQANIGHNDKTLLKIEEKTEGHLHFFLRASDNDICYTISSILNEENLITDITETFQNHRDIERVLMALLELQ